jgi:tRNA(fMet)-specific endonuclease VapC
MPAWTNYCAKSAPLLPVVFDTNVVIAHLRRQQLLPLRAVLPFAVVGELEAFALKADWGYQKVAFLRQLLERYPLVGFVPELASLYARLDAYSQGKLRGQPLPVGMSARNMGKNDLWIAATALYLDLPLHTADNDFDHLPPLGLALVKEAT